ncbi:Protein-arginine deiminase [Stanieria sp. NIES-3757]|nr:Protein-arginine deiminase [Stanieria sp. NIES-3757]
MSTLSNSHSTDQAIVSFKTRGEIEVYSSTNQLITSLNPVPVREIPEITLLARTFSDRILDRCLQITFQEAIERLTVIFYSYLLLII